MTSFVSLRWIALALAGLALAAGVSVAASRLVSQRIGLAAELPSAGRALAPPEHGQPGKGDQAGGGGGPPNSVPTSTTTTPSTTTPTSPTTSPAPAPTTTAPATVAPPSSSPSGRTEGEGPDD